MRRISMGTRDELLEAVAGRYRAATRVEKGHILTEFAEISGYHRKHAERLLPPELVGLLVGRGREGHASVLPASSAWSR